MLSRTEIKTFQAHRDYPSVSILAPTHRTAPSNRKDPIKVKNLINKAIDRLHGEFEKREVAPIVKNLQKLSANMEWQHTLDGLALFASRRVAASVKLPFRVKPRAMIDETFATRDLVYSFNRAAPYRVLVLGHTTRLFEAWTTVLEEHTAKPFPVLHRGRGGKAKLPGGLGVNRSAARDKAEHAHARVVDDAVGVLQKSNPLPIVLVGAERTLAYYQEVTRHGKSVVGMLAGNHERTSAAALGALVWPVFDAGAIKSRIEAMVKLDQAVGMKRSASGINQVWKAAVAGKCSTLLVDKEFKYPADLHADGDRLLTYTGKGAAALDDAVDEAIERVIATGGEVYFYPPGDLDAHHRIAAVLRR